MITCLTNYITLGAGYSPTASVSGLTLADHPEVSLKRLERLTDPEKATINELWTRIYNRAIVEFTSDVEKASAMYFNRRNVITSVTAGEYISPSEPTVPGPELRGVYIELDRIPHGVLSIESVTFYSAGAGTLDITILDANTGFRLDQITGNTLAAGYNVVQIGKTYAVSGRTRRYFVCYDATSLSGIKTSTANYAVGCHTCEVMRGADEVLELRGASISSGDTAIETNLSKSNDSGGLIVNFDILCSIEQMICNNREVFGRLLWYRCAVEFLRELEHTDRLNSFTLLNSRERVKEILYGGEDRPGIFGAYYELLDRTMQSFTPEHDPYCMECAGSMNKRDVLP